MTEVKMEDQESKDDISPAGRIYSETEVPDAGTEGFGQAVEERGSKGRLEDLSQSELIEKLQAAQTDRDRHFDFYLRSQAEMENLKKRFQKEKDGLIRFANESLIKDLLPVADNLEKAMNHSRGETGLEGLREGIDLTLKGLMETLKKAGVQEVSAQGLPFDPNYHDAISEIENNEVDQGTVIQELQKGYLLNNRLLRPATVIVSRKGS